MKLLKKVMIIIGITIIGIGGYFLWDYLYSPKEAKVTDKPTIEELLEQSVDTETITTNFADSGYIKAQFKIITTSPKNAEELKKLSFLVESTMIKSINGMKKVEASGPKGFALLESRLRDDLNKNLGDKYISHVYIVDLLLQ